MLGNPKNNFAFLNLKNGDENKCAISSLKSIKKRMQQQFKKIQ